MKELAARLRPGCQSLQVEKRGYSGVTLKAVPILEKWQAPSLFDDAPREVIQPTRLIRLAKQTMTDVRIGKRTISGRYGMMDVKIKLEAG